jgi:hypothetical protein
MNTALLWSREDVMDESEMVLWSFPYKLVHFVVTTNVIEMIMAAR